MRVRCGRCQAELEVSGPGEFVCPACGTRNAVRGAPAPPAAGNLGGLGGLTVPGGAPPPPPADPGSVRWASCPSCSYRFAMGEVEQVSCPNCSARLEVSDGGLRAAEAEGR